jgi:hypothetical protein
MLDPVIPKIKRILERGNLIGYQSLLDKSELAFKYSPSETGEIFGVYRNEISDNVYVAYNGLILDNLEGQKFLLYKEMIRTEWAGPHGIITIPPLSAADRILITLVDASQHVVQIKHGNGRLRDVFELIRFLDRVSNGVRSFHGLS